MSMGNFEVKDTTHVNFGFFQWHEDGSFTVKRPETFESDEVSSLAIALLWDSSEDFELSGEDGCAGNYDMYTPLFNANNGYEYLILYSQAEDWKEGKEVTIHGRQPSEEDLKDIWNYIDGVC